MNQETLQKIEKWEKRMSAMDHSRGRTNTMVQRAMRAEIAELRKAVGYTGRRIVELQTQRDEWKEQAIKYRKAVLKATP